MDPTAPGSKGRRKRPKVSMKVALEAFGEPNKLQ